MELLSYRIEQPLSDHRPIVIAPIGDIQFNGAKGPTARRILKEHIQQCMEERAWFLGMGDYIDFMSPSNRVRRTAAAFYDLTDEGLDDHAINLTRELYEEFLKPTKGRWIGMLHGHHWTQLKTGETSDQRLCQLLDTTFLGTSAFIRLVFRVPKSTARSNVVIWAHHGCGGGQKAGAPLGKIEDQAAVFPGADIYVMGHTTKQPVAPIERVFPRWHGPSAPDLVHKRVYLVNSGGFARGHAKGSKLGNVPMGSYVEQGMMRPASLGAPIIRITPHRELSPGVSHFGSWSPRIRVEV